MTLNPKFQNKEIKKGKFLIGLKQYLGGENDSFSEKKNINFTTNKGFLNLISSNGIKHKSKQINIVWADIPVKNPKTIERIVFGPFASYESAKKQSDKLRDKGFETTVAYPKNWEVWISFQDNLPEFELKNKIFRKVIIFLNLLNTILYLNTLKNILDSKFSLKRVSNY